MIDSSHVFHMLTSRFACHDLISDVHSIQHRVISFMNYNHIDIDILAAHMNRESPLSNMKKTGRHGQHAILRRSHRVNSVPLQISWALSGLAKKSRSFLDYKIGFMSLRSPHIVVKWKRMHGSGKTSKVIIQIEQTNEHYMIMIRYVFTIVQYNDES
jgi:hypothetical protein